MFKWGFRAKKVSGTFRKINVIVTKTINELYKQDEKITNILF